MVLSAHPLAKLRREAGLSQAELAERAGVSRSLVSTLELGKRPGRDARAKLVAALGADPWAGAVDRPHDAGGR